MIQLETIIFDLGGILVPEGWSNAQTRIAREAKTTPEILAELINPLRSRATKGEITLFEVYSEVAKKLGLENPQGLLDIHMKLYEEHQTERDPKIIELVRKLKEKYNVVALTNTEKEIAEFNKNRGLFDYFERAFISCDMGMMKPDRDIYEKVVSDLNVPAESCLFIDDKPEYIEGARYVGINAIRFRNYGQLSRDLKEFKILD